MRRGGDGGDTTLCGSPCSRTHGDQDACSFTAAPAAGMLALRGMACAIDPSRRRVLGSPASDQFLRCAFGRDSKGGASADSLDRTQ